MFEQNINAILFNLNLSIYWTMHDEMLVIHRAKTEHSQNEMSGKLGFLKRGNFCESI